MDNKNPPPVPVGNAASLLSAFGYWPSFHDAEVHQALLDRGGSGERPSVTLVVHAFDTDGSVDEKGYYRVTTSVLVTLKFGDVRESELRDLGSQNVLSSLELEPDTSGLVRVTLGPCYGLTGSLLCGEVTVLSVAPWPSPTEDPRAVDADVGSFRCGHLHRDLRVCIRMEHLRRSGRAVPANEESNRHVFPDLFR